MNYERHTINFTDAMGLLRYDGQRRQNKTNCKVYWCPPLTMREKTVAFMPFIPSLSVELEERFRKVYSDAFEVRNAKHDTVYWNFSPFQNKKITDLSVNHSQNNMSFRPRIKVFGQLMLVCLLVSFSPEQERRREDGKLFVGVWTQLWAILYVVWMEMCTKHFGLRQAIRHHVTNVDSSRKQKKGRIPFLVCFMKRNFFIACRLWEAQLVFLRWQTQHKQPKFELWKKSTLVRQLSSGRWADSTILGGTNYRRKPSANEFCSLIQVVPDCRACNTGTASCRCAQNKVDKWKQTVEERGDIRASYCCNPAVRGSFLPPRPSQEHRTLEHRTLYSFLSWNVSLNVSKIYPKKPKAIRAVQQQNATGSGYRQSFLQRKALVWQENRSFKKWLQAPQHDSNCLSVESSILQESWSAFMYQCYCVCFTR